MRRALVVGAGGQLGETMSARLASTHDVVAVTRRELDVTDGTAVTDLIDRTRPTVVVNCSAYTNVDGAEDEPVQAFAVNAMAVRWLARASADAGATLVHYSTDFVFDGTASELYTELDAPNPKGAYAMSKLLGEWFAADAGRHYVLRVESLFGGVRAKSSVDKILANVKSGVPVKAFADRTVSPSFVDDVAMATIALLERDAPPGLYHCVNSGWTTWVGISEELARLAGRPEAAIEHVRMSDVGLRAPRPLFAALSNAKLASLGIVMPTWQEALARYVQSVL
jgi:dTDP-4-dehydrorhamnose reductase